MSKIISVLQIYVVVIFGISLIIPLSPANFLFDDPLYRISPPHWLLIILIRNLDIIGCVAEKAY